MNNFEQELRDTIHSVLDRQEPQTSFEQVWERNRITVYSNYALSRKRILKIGIPFVIVLGTGVAALASGFLSNYTQNLKSSSSTTGVFEYINGKPVSNRDFQEYKAGQELVAELNHQSISEQEIVQNFNLQQVAYQEARKQHLMATLAKAKQYSLQTRQMIENPPSNADKSSLTEIRKILKAQEEGLGVSDNQYWTQVAPRSYQVGLSVANLRQQFASKYKSQHPNTQYNDVMSAWSEYERNLLSKAAIRKP